VMLPRQSTTVPNTSKARALTLAMGEISGIAIILQPGER
jgi:hypothetical protein